MDTKDRNLEFELLLTQKRLGKWGSCMTTYSFLFFFIPHCDRYQLGEKLKIVGRITDSNARENILQKRLMLEEISIVESRPVSGIYLLSKILGFSLVIKEKIQKLFDFGYIGMQKTTAEAFIFGDLSLLPPLDVQQLRQTGGSFLFVHSGYQFFLFLSWLSPFLQARVVKKIAVIVFAPMFVIYMTISGITIGTLRSVLFYSSYFFVAVIFKRQQSYRVILVWELAFFFLFLPQSILDSTFLFSSFLLIIHSFFMPMFIKILHKSMKYKLFSKRISFSIFFHLWITPLLLLLTNSLQLMPLLFLPITYIFYPFLLFSCLFFITGAAIYLPFAHILAFFPELGLSIFMTLNRSFANALGFLNFNLSKIESFLLLFVWGGLFIFLWSRSRQPKHTYRLY